MSTVPTLEQLTISFGNYVELFYELPDKSILRPTKAKKHLTEAELKVHEGWNKHLCKICGQSVLGGCGTGWSNLSHHITSNHKIGGTNTSWRDFLMPCTSMKISDHFSYSDEIQCIHFFLNLIIQKNLPLQCCEWKDLRRGNYYFLI